MAPLTALQPTTAVPRRALRRAEAAAEERFREFYEREYPRIAGFAYTLVHDEELARDLAQEAFSRLLTRWVSVREPRPYVFLVVTNLARERWRRQTKERASYALLAADAVDTTPAHGVGSAIHDAVRRLPDAHRRVVELYYFADLPVPEVAAVLRRPEGTVKRLLSEARGHLAAALGDRHA